MLKIAHLVDDTTAGGVTRYLAFLNDDPILNATADHQVIAVPRNRPSGLPDGVDMIVSHLSINWAGLPGLMALRARYSGVPILHVEHSYSEAFTAINVPKRGRFHRLLRTAYALFDRVVAVSPSQGDWLVRNDLVRQEALEVIFPMVDLDGLDRIAAPKGPVRHFGAIGRFDPQKGFDTLIRAFRTLDDPQLTLTLYGEGAQQAELERLATGDARIRFPGFAPRPSEAYAACDVIAMPSRWEPYGLVALEANVAGRRVMMSAVDGLRDQAQRDNILVTDQGVDGWRDALGQVAGAPVGLDLRPGAKALRDTTVDAWSDLCDRVALPAHPAEACVA